MCVNKWPLKFSWPFKPMGSFDYKYLDSKEKKTQYYTDLKMSILFLVLYDYRIFRRYITVIVNQTIYTYVICEWNTWQEFYYKHLLSKFQLEKVEANLRISNQPSPNNCLLQEHPEKVVIKKVNICAVMNKESVLFQQKIVSFHFNY